MSYSFGNGGDGEDRGYAPLPPEPGQDDMSCPLWDQYFDARSGECVCPAGTTADYYKEACVKVSSSSSGGAKPNGQPSVASFKSSTALAVLAVVGLSWWLLREKK